LDGPRLPDEIVEQINTVLGVAGKPHFASMPHQRLATGCVVWELQSLETPNDIEQAVEDVQKMLPNDIDVKLAQVRVALANQRLLILLKVLAEWLCGGTNR
jgi:hypothetical protein